MRDVEDVERKQLIAVAGDILRKICFHVCEALTNGTLSSLYSFLVCDKVVTVAIFLWVTVTVTYMEEKKSYLKSLVL